MFYTNAVYFIFLCDPSVNKLGGYKNSWWADYFVSDWSTLFSWFLVKCFSCGFLYWSHGRSRRFCLQLDKYSNKSRIEAAKMLGFFSRTCVSFLFLFCFFFFGALLFKYIYLTKTYSKTTRLCNGNRPKFQCNRNIHPFLQYQTLQSGRGWDWARFFENVPKLRLRA